MTLCETIPSGFRSPALLAGLPEDTPILVGFSGGADSVSLLHMLVTYAKTTGATVYAAHVNHGIRGEEADRDERFCREVTDALGVDLFICHADIPNLAKKRGKGIEETARSVRYEFFDSVMAERNIPLLVTAHNADDNLETMLFHLVRGTGLGGMCGIPLSRRCAHGTLARPLLCVTRNEILAYCDREGLSFVTDSTNTDVDYTRNRIRKEVIPALCSIHGSAVENAVRLAEHLRADHLCLESMTDWFLEELQSDASLEIEKINGSPDAIVNRALMALFSHVSGGTNLTHAHVEALRDLCRRGVPHSSVSLPASLVGVIEDGKLRFLPKSNPLAVEPYRVPISHETYLISQTNTEIIMGRSQKTRNVYKNSILLSIDSAKINGALYARNRQGGDRIRLRGMSRSVKKLFCDQKIPVELRNRLPVLCDDDGVLAVPTLGIRDGAAASADTEDVITLEIVLHPSREILCGGT